VFGGENKSLYNESIWRVLLAVVGCYLPKVRVPSESQGKQRCLPFFVPVALSVEHPYSERSVSSQKYVLTANSNCSMNIFLKGLMLFCS
jgi:hypothetical protein